MISTGASPGRKLNEKQAQFVLNFGVALAYSGNNRGITRLSRDYLKEMDSTTFKDAFRLIASPDNIGLIDYFSGNNILFIEWSEYIKSILPKDINNISFDIVSQNERLIKCNE